MPPMRTVCTFGLTFLEAGRSKRAYVADPEVAHVCRNPENAVFRLRVRVRVRVTLGFGQGLG